MNVFEIKVTLQDIRPFIWRRIQVPVDIRLGKFHRVLQAAMGWTNSHLHAFRIGDATYGVPHPDSPDLAQGGRAIPLDKVAGPGDAFLYEYDFGDGWMHEIKIEKVLPADPAVHYPRCLTGERACPPEDCGGPPGYEDLLAVLRDSAHPEHQEIREWAGPRYDPEAFDPAEINRLLWRLH